MKLFIGNKNYSSWSLRPWILMRVLDIPFEEELIPFDVGTSFEKFRSFSRSGLVPCLHDGEIVVWDSLAIAEYLAESNPSVWPADAATRAWARCVTAEMHSGFSALRNQCSMNCGLRVELSGIDAALQKDIGRVNEIWTEGIERFGVHATGPGETCKVELGGNLLHRPDAHDGSFAGGSATHRLRQTPDQPGAGGLERVVGPVGHGAPRPGLTAGTT